jgi:hypothetical protein
MPEAGLPVNLAPAQPGIRHGQILWSPNGAGRTGLQAMHEYVPSRNFLTFLAPHTYSRHTPTARCPGVKTRGVRAAAAWLRSAGRR